MIHYIYINRKNKNDTTIPQQVLNCKLNYDKWGIPVRIHTFPSIYQELNEYNPEYARLFSMINPLLPACMADIGRIFILYKYGGIYHDCRFYIDDILFYNLLLQKIDIYGYVIERHPNKMVKWGCRNGNMAATINNKLFKQILDRQFLNLKRIECELIDDNTKTHNFWRQIGMVFLEILLENNNIDPNTFNVNNVPNNEHFCINWQLCNLPKFYNDEPSSHWSTMQQTNPLLIL